MPLAANLFESDWGERKEKTIIEKLINPVEMKWLSFGALFILFFYTYREVII